MTCPPQCPTCGAIRGELWRSIHHDEFYEITPDGPLGYLVAPRLAWVRRELARRLLAPSSNG